MFYFEDLISILASIYLIFLFFQINTCTLYARPIDESRCRIVVLWPSLLSKTRFQTLCMVFFIFFRNYVFSLPIAAYYAEAAGGFFFLPSHAHKTKATYFFSLTPMFFFKWAGALVRDVAQRLGSAKHSACTACSAAETA